MPARLRRAHLAARLPNNVRMCQHVMIMPWVKQDASCGLSCHRMMLETTAEHELPMPPNKVSQGDGGSDEGELSGADRTSPSVPGVLSA